MPEKADAKALAEREDRGPAPQQEPAQRSRFKRIAAACVLVWALSVGMLTSGNAHPLLAALALALSAAALIAGAIEQRRARGEEGA